MSLSGLVSFITRPSSPIATSILQPGIELWTSKLSEELHWLRPFNFNTFYNYFQFQEQHLVMGLGLLDLLTQAHATIKSCS